MDSYRSARSQPALDLDSELSLRGVSVGKNWSTLSVIILFVGNGNKYDVGLFYSLLK